MNASRWTQWSPIRYEADAPSFLYISAQNTGEDGELKCLIQMDDVVLAENTSSGAYAIVTCQASK